MRGKWMLATMLAVLAHGNVWSKTSAVKNLKQPASLVKIADNATPSSIPDTTWQAALPPGAGRDTTLRVCSRCHQPSVIATQRLNPDEWRDIVDTMVRFGAVADDLEISEITAYLSRAFPRAHAAPSPAS